MLEKWKLVLDKEPIGPMFMDLSNAFNTLNHKLLLGNVYRRTNINDKSLGKKSMKVYRSVPCYALPTRQEDVVAMSQWRLSLCPSNVVGTSQMKHSTMSQWNYRQGVSVVRLHDVLLENPDNVSRGRNNDVLSVRLHDISNKSQMKHPKMSQWYVTKTSP